MFKLASQIVGFVACIAIANVAFAQEIRTGSIDKALNSSLDFRSTAFEPCLAEVTCEVAGITLIAERLVEPGVWDAAEIYWDPIDGVGILGGRQNDEIDVDERLTLIFDREVEVSGLWLSDLFIGEAARYENRPLTTEDTETARFELFFGVDRLLEARVNGMFELPEETFESSFTDMFDDGGDLLNRVLINEDTITVYAPGQSSDQAVTLPIGDVDPAKKALFGEETTSTQSIAGLLGNAREVAAFEAGSSNAKRLLAIRNNLQELEALRVEAQIQRLVGDAENGELGWYRPEPVTVDRIVFTADPQTSNDYSIAGIVVKDDVPLRVAELVK